MSAEVPFRVTAKMILPVELTIYAVTSDEAMEKARQLPNIGDVESATWISPGEDQ